MTADELFAAAQAAIEHSRAVMDEAAAALRAAHLANDALRADAEGLHFEIRMLRMRLAAETYPPRWSGGGAA